MKRALVPLIAAIFVSTGAVSTLAAPVARAATAPAWTIVPSPNAPAAVSGRGGGDLRGVACPTTTNCFVVGEYGDGSSRMQPLVGRSIGSTWSIGPAPRPADFTPAFGRLAGVACPSVTTCFAVGDYHSGFSGPRTLIEKWDGKAWTIMKSPNPPDATEISLSGVSCASVTSCFAVGSAQGGVAAKTLLEQWNGTTWKIVGNAPKLSGTNGLAGVSCPSIATCVAVGHVMGGKLQKTLVERWNGSTWSVVKSANPLHFTRAQLSGVACPTTKVCFAVGDSYDDRTGDTRTLVERSNGENWSLVTTPDASSGDLGDSRLSAISCATPIACVAVGSGPYVAVIEKWDGVSWKLVSSPDPELVQRRKPRRCQLRAGATVCRRGR